jgi:hypothetical protein
MGKWEEETGRVVEEGRWEDERVRRWDNGTEKRRNGEEDWGTWRRGEWLKKDEKRVTV